METDLGNCFMSNDITIIIPVYNTSKYLVRCLDSVSRINYPIKVLLIDDGSTDDSANICDQYVLKDARYSVIHKQNEGLVVARKNGIENVKTHFFTFVDSDDYVDSIKYTDLLIKVFSEEYASSDIVCIGMTEEYLENEKEVINNFSNGVYDGDKLDKLRNGMLSKGEFFRFGILPNAVCKIINTEFANNNPINVDSQIKIGEDADMTFQYLLKAKRVSILNISAYHYCRRENSMMSMATPMEAIGKLERDLRNAFLEYKYENNLSEQLEDYIRFLYLLCCPEKLLKEDKFFTNPNDRIALYGAGGVGKAIKNYKQNDITLWVDKKFPLYGEEVKPVEELVLKKHEYDKVFIAISDVIICQKVKEELIEMGINKPIYYYGFND